jgi:hypothetical protein
MRSFSLQSLAGFVASAICVGPLAGQSIGTSGPVLTVPGSSTVILAGISYQANDQNGLVFRTGPATLSLDGSTLSFALTGPGAAGASVIATIAAVPDGYVLNWTIATASPANWNIYTSGFTLSLPQTPTAARLAKAVKWTAPTGAQSWENPGDTPYPDTEFQVRQMDLLGSTVAWLSSYYDPNWFSGQNLASTPFSVFTPSFSSPGVASVQMGLFAVGATRQNPVQLAAEAAGRPLGLTLTTPNAGNLFEPGDQVPLSATVYNVTGQSLQATLSIQVWDYSGTEITQLTPTTTFGAGATQSFALHRQLARRRVCGRRLDQHRGDSPLPRHYRSASRAAGQPADSQFGLRHLIGAGATIHISRPVQHAHDAFHDAAHRNSAGPQQLVRPH